MPDIALDINSLVRQKKAEIKLPSATSRSAIASKRSEQQEETTLISGDAQTYSKKLYLSATATRIYKNNDNTSDQWIDVKRVEYEEIYNSDNELIDTITYTYVEL